MKEPYIGQTGLITGEIAEDLTYYFATSEQVPTSVALGVLMNHNNTVKQAGGFIIQLMPFAEDEVIDRLEAKIKEITSITALLDEGLTPEQILEKVLGEFGLEINDKIPTRYHCNCSHERVAKVLLSVGKKELESMIADGKPIEVNCHFCNKNHVFQIEELKELLKKAGYSADDITNFDSFKKVVEDITANKDKLGFSAFTSAGMDGSSDWRFKTHLANLPIYYEYKADGIDSTDAIKGTYLDNYKQIWDLYLNNSTCEPSMISSKTGDDAASEFALGEAVFYQNGTWAYNDIKDNEVADEDMGMLPIYIGVDGEENQGLCTGSENYWCVNKNASEEDIQATLDFMKWVVESDEVRDMLANEMGFVTPFTTFSDYLPDNPLVKANAEYTEAGKTPVSWNFTTMPSENWKNNLGGALLNYAQGTGAWDSVQTAFVDGWAEEYAAANE